MSNPFHRSITTARMLAEITDYVPSSVLQAAAEALFRAAEETFAQVNRHPGRRGNPARRDQARNDSYSARQLSEAAGARRRIFDPPEEDAPQAPPTTPPAHLLQVEAAPDLGPNQWAVVAANAVTWSGTPANLYMVAAATVPDETPLDLQDWLTGHRRRQAVSDLDRAEQRVKSHLVWVRMNMEAAHAATQRALQGREAADRWMQALSLRRQVADLTDEDLAEYESAVLDGLTPATALARLRQRRWAR